jgi:pilus assembly protein Flp/PilA
LVEFRVQTISLMVRKDSQMLGLATRLFQSERGATAIEYGLIAALIAVAAISAWQLVGTSLSDVFSGVATFI